MHPGLDVRFSCCQHPVKEVPSIHGLTDMPITCGRLVQERADHNRNVGGRARTNQRLPLKRLRPSGALGVLGSAALRVCAHQLV